MTIQRISTFAVHQRTQGDVSRVQTDLFGLQKQLSSGFKTDTFSGLNGQVEQFTSLEAKIRKSDVYIENNSVALSRLNTTQVTMDKIIQTVDSIEDLMTLRRNPANAQSMNFPQQLDGLRTVINSLLNTSFEGRYIFGGTNTNTPPVIEPTPDPAAVGVPDDGYYQGSKEDVTLRAQDNLEIAYGLRADETGFQKVYAAISMALKGHASNSDTAISDSQQLLQDGLQDILAAQARVNSNIVAVQNINERHSDLKLYWKGVSEEVIKTDIVSTSTSVAEDQAILQATFQSFATINRLRLVDFL